MHKIDFNLEDNPFYNFQSSRYSMSARVNVKKAYEFAKKEDYSFFLITLASLLKAANDVEKLRFRIINNEVVEFESMDGVTPIMDESKNSYCEMRVKNPDNFLSWHKDVKKLSKDILSEKIEGFNLPMEKRDEENIINFSCIPWVDFDSITTAVLHPRQIQPLITWGKFDKDYEMTVSITVNHIFVAGSDLAKFYKKAQYYLDNVEKLFK
ncbi:CatA-like O-acetyltransferase [Methanobrevibacter woesei]|uniref:CatA-like O-acetyltransferase n=1 Tax=Methanobrevibacter woesei TaxID=190976 RepID=UPI0039F461E2